MKVSIVIPAHNAAATLGQCLIACTNQSYPDCEVIVVDDGSTDATAEIARSFPVTLIKQAQRGPAAARNSGARASIGAAIVFTDSDCVPHPDWIERLIAPLKDEIAAIGGTYGIANPDSALARLIHTEILLRHSQYGQHIDFAGSYNAAIRRDIFLEVNGFDENFKSSSAEDNDLCYRVADVGHTIAFARDAIVDHYHPTHLWKYLRAQARHGFWRMKLYAKHPGRKSGDNYARGVELWAPVYAATLLVLLAVSAIFSAIVPLYGVALVLTPLLLLYRFVTALRIARTNRSVRLARSAITLFLRDFARGLGLVSGFCYFLVLRKATA